jgi:glycosyltransferase involved in cell wall biosynthesis
MRPPDRPRMTPVTSPPGRRTARHSPRRNGGLAFASVLHVNEKGGSFGGTEEYIALITSALRARGVRSHLVCGVVSGRLPSDLASVHVVEGLASRRPRPDTAEALTEVVAELDPDVIYVHNIFDPAAVWALAGISGRGMLMWYVHDHYLTCLSELRWRRDIGSCPHRLSDRCLLAIQGGHCVLRYPDQTYARADVERRMSLSESLEAADAIVVVSSYMRTLVLEAQPQLDARLHLLSRPIRELGRRRFRYRTRPVDPAVVTYAGRITAEKGLAVVIEALAAASCDAPVEFRIAGVIEDQDYWSQCQQLQAVATANNPGLTITYLGHLDYDATDELFRQSDVVTVPSLWPEPLGAVAIEAMSAGAAVIASSVGGLNDTLVHDHNGLHASPGDVDSWATALTTLLRHPEHAHRLGHQAHRDFARIAIGDHLDVLDDIVSAHRPASRPVAPGRVDGNEPVRR